METTASTPNVPDATGIVIREISSSVVFNSFELVITFNDQADAAAVGAGAAGSAVAYNSTSDNPTDTADTASRTVTFELTDAAGTGDPLTQTITIIPVNDAPVNAVPPALQMVDDDTALVFNATNNNLISVSDVDAGTEDVQATLAVTSGALTLSSIANLAFLDGDGATDASMTFTGSLVDINAALAAGLTYQGNGDFNGLDALTITTNDLGNTGAVAGDADAEQDEDTVLIQVAAVNDAPTSAGNTVTTPEDTTYAFKISDFNFADVDDFNGDVLASVKITARPNASLGSLELNGQPIDTDDVVVTALQITNGELTFVPTPDVNGPEMPRSSLRSTTARSSAMRRRPWSSTSPRSTMRRSPRT